MSSLQASGVIYANALLTTICVCVWDGMYRKVKCSKILSYTTKMSCRIDLWHETTMRDIPKRSGSEWQQTGAPCKRKKVDHFIPKYMFILCQCFFFYLKSILKYKFQCSANIHSKSKVLNSIDQKRNGDDIRGPTVTMYDDDYLKFPADEKFRYEIAFDAIHFSGTQRIFIEMPLYIQHIRCFLRVFLFISTANM